MLGRVIGIICSLLGIFFIAMIFVFLVLYVTLDDEEKIAYSKICYLYKKKSQSDDFNDYMNCYIKYKMIKYKKDKLLQTILNKNKYDCYKNKHFYSLIKGNNDSKGIVLHNFARRVNDSWNNNFTEINNILNDNINPIVNEISRIIYSSKNSYELCSVSVSYVFKSFNLMNFNSSVGFFFLFNENNNFIQAQNLIQSSRLKHSLIGLFKLYDYNDYIFKDDYENISVDYFKDKSYQSEYKQIDRENYENNFSIVDENLDKFIYLKNDNQNNDNFPELTKKYSRKSLLNNSYNKIHNVLVKLDQIYHENLNFNQQSNLVEIKKISNIRNPFRKKTTNNITKGTKFFEMNKECMERKKSSNLLKSYFKFDDSEN